MRAQEYVENLNEWPILASFFNELVKYPIEYLNGASKGFFDQVMLKVLDDQVGIWVMEIDGEPVGMNNKPPYKFFTKFEAWNQLHQLYPGWEFLDSRSVRKIQEDTARKNELKTLLNIEV